MDFNLTQEQEMIRKMVRDFGEKEVKGIAAEIDKTMEFPWDVIKKMGELGLMGMTIDEKYGGPGLDTVSYAIAVEEMSRACGTVGFTMAAHNSLCTAHINLAGNEEQKIRYLPDLATGKAMGAWGLTEPGAGSDASSLQTTAVPEGDEWVLNGRKIFITNGHVAETFVVLASTDREKRTKGISAFIIEKDTPGFSLGKKEDKMGLRASPTSELIMEDCRIPKENLLGEKDMGFIGALKILDGGRISIAAMALGIAQSALDESLAYSKERVQFGKAICEFQAIQWMLADMATEIEAARFLTYRAANMKDRKVRFTKEAAMAKLFASEMGMRATSKAIQIFGGYGFTKDYPVERMFRDVKLCEIGEGTSEIQRLVIARQLLKES
ncbi:MAG: acyl-CoA dehydrogenase [Methanomassiliicoccales archaeon]|nr:MAG: acyl-CoA dehydrogenase [Methanomassiliicoccales archaeon]